MCLNPLYKLFHWELFIVQQLIRMEICGCGDIMSLTASWEMAVQKTTMNRYALQNSKSSGKGMRERNVEMPEMRTVFQE